MYWTGETNFMNINCCLCYCNIFPFLDHYIMGCEGSNSTRHLKSSLFEGQARLIMGTKYSISSRNIFKWILKEVSKNIHFTLFFKRKGYGRYLDFFTKKPDTSNIKWKIKASTFSKTEIFFVSGRKVSCHGIHYMEQWGRDRSPEDRTTLLLPQIYVHTLYNVIET